LGRAAVNGNGLTGHRAGLDGRQKYHQRRDPIGGLLIQVHEVADINL
jgi:hypothetical protein